MVFTIVTLHIITPPVKMKVSYESEKHTRYEAELTLHDDPNVKGIPHSSSEYSGSQYETNRPPLSTGLLLPTLSIKALRSSGVSSFAGPTGAISR